MSVSVCAAMSQIRAEVVYIEPLEAHENNSSLLELCLITNWLNWARDCIHLKGRKIYFQEKAQISTRTTRTTRKIGSGCDTGTSGSTGKRKGGWTKIKLEGIAGA